MPASIVVGDSGNNSRRGRKNPNILLPQICCRHHWVRVVVGSVVLVFCIVVVVLVVSCGGGSSVVRGRATILVPLSVFPRLHCVYFSLSIIRGVPIHFCMY